MLQASWENAVLVIIPKWVADFGLWLNRLYYQQIFISVYGRRKQPPAWFDHRIDLYYHWPHNLFWLERGILPRKHMFDGCTVLDLFCGDGFYSRYFYSTITGHIDAIDKDPRAIAHAKRWHSHPRIHYATLDAVKEEFPRSRYDVIVWFEAIEHLSQADYKALVQRIKSAIGTTGVLVGSTTIVPEDQLGKCNWEHQNEFASISKLQEFLSRDFSEIQTEVTVYPVVGGWERCTAYFTVAKSR